MQKNRSRLGERSRRSPCPARSPSHTHPAPNFSSPRSPTWQHTPLRSREAAKTHTPPPASFGETEARSQLQQTSTSPACLHPCPHPRACGIAPALHTTNAPRGRAAHGGAGGAPWRGRKERGPASWVPTSALAVIYLFQSRIYSGQLQICCRQAATDTVTLSSSLFPFFPPPLQQNWTSLNPSFYILLFRPERGMFLLQLRCGI